MNLEIIVKEFYPQLYRYARFLTRNESEAADLTQETFFGWFKSGEIQRPFVGRASPPVRLPKSAKLALLQAAGEAARATMEFSQNSSVSDTHDGGPPGSSTQQTKQVGLSGLIQR
jgi:hypothetical protein